MKPIVMFDLETSGLELDHEIIQIGAVAVQGDRILDKFELKLRFDVEKADPKALELNGFAAENWVLAAFPEPACQAFARWLKPYCHIEKQSARTGNTYKVARLGGYNAAVFDAPRLQQLFKNNDVFLPADYGVLDVLHLARWYYELNPDCRPENLKLATVCAAFDIPLENAHDALSDVIATAKLAQALLGRN